VNTTSGEVDTVDFALERADTGIDEYLAELDAALVGI
jgi:hypothetical protein